MRQYQDLVRRVLDHGEQRPDRTGTGTVSFFGERFSIDLGLGFPLVTSKFTSFKNVREELLWFLRGETNVRSLREKNCKIWDPWADADGNVGPIYGYQWRRWGEKRGSVGLNQVSTLELVIDNDPWSRRQLVSAWNVSDLSDMTLPPCHVLWQTYVHADAPSIPLRGETPLPNAISMQVYMRSLDLFIGFPYDLASYALLLSMLGRVHGLTPRWLIFVVGDAHVYSNHVDLAREMIRREPFMLPRLEINDGKAYYSVDGFASEDLQIREYEHHPAMRAEVAV